MYFMGYKPLSDLMSCNHLWTKREKVQHFGFMLLTTIIECYYMILILFLAFGKCWIAGFPPFSIVCVDFLNSLLSCLNIKHPCMESWKSSLGCLILQWKTSILFYLLCLNSYFWLVPVKHHLVYWFWVNSFVGRSKHMHTLIVYDSIMNIWVPMLHQFLLICQFCKWSDSL